MAKGPLISLILVIKNGITYLNEAIKSVSVQSYHDYELVVQDGGSTDGSLELLRDAKKLPTVKIESKSDSGLGEAYNRALTRCRGDIVGTIDCDNLLEQEALAHVARYFSSNAVAAIYGSCKIINHQSEPIGFFQPVPFGLLSLLRCELVPPFSTAFFSRRQCNDQLRFDAQFTKCQDFDLWLRLSHLPIKAINHCLGSTRLSDASMSCRSELYDAFCAEKTLAIERFVDHQNSKSFSAMKNHFLAGVYTWAAESVYNIQGQSDLFERYYQRAIELDPQLVHARITLKRVQQQLHDKQNELARTWDILADCSNALHDRDHTLHTQNVDLHRLASKLAELEGSKFLKLRKIWLQFKKQFPLGKVHQPCA